MTQSSDLEDRKDTHVATAAQFLARAADAFRSENYPLAETILRQLLTARPDVAPAWHLRGLTARATGDDRSALAFCMKAVSADSGNADYCAALGDALEMLGRDHDAVVPWQQALALAPDIAANRLRFADLLGRLGRENEAFEQYDLAARLAPDTITVQYAFGLALARRQEFDQAEIVFRRCLTLDAESPDASFQHARCLQALDRHEEAIAGYENTLIRQPDRAEAHVNLSVIYRGLGQLDKAVQEVEHALDLQPNSVGALNNLGLALCDLGQHATAATFLRTARQIEPDNPITVHNLGVALHACGAMAESERFLKEALTHRPDWPEATRSLGNLYRETGRLAEAMALYRDAIERHPDDFRMLGNLGLVLLNLNQPHDAIATYEKAVALNSSHADLRTSLGIAQLLIGDLENGWSNYEARWEKDGSAGSNRILSTPRWDGGPLGGVDGKPGSLLVHAEQGYGDTLHFCRYLPLLAAQNNLIVFECQSPLVGLMESLGVTEDRLDLTVIARGNPLPNVDAHIPLLSLPAHFETTLETIPRDVPYLKAPAPAATAWARRLAGGEPAVGLVWAGNAERQDDWMRSCPPDAMAPLLDIDGIRFYSLQKDGPPLEHAAVEPLGPELNDFSDTAAAIEALDLVISVDTAVAHLAGALGKPVWVILGAAADWRYMLDRKDSPWYPTMRLFRASELGDWTGVAGQVANALRSSLSHRGDGKISLKF